MAQICFGAIMAKTQGYVKQNWGSPFIVMFILLLACSAVFLSTGLSDLADSVAVYAYYALVAGVILQFICFLKNKKNAGEAI